MFTLQDRKKAVLQLIEYDMQYTATIRKLGYPNDYRTLKKWHVEFISTGELHETRKKKPKYTDEQKKYAVDYYITHGKNAERTIRNIGYPCKSLLNKWIQEIAPEEKRHCTSGGRVLYSTRERKEAAVIALCTRNTSAKEVARDFSVSREGLYAWKKQLLGKGKTLSMKLDKTTANTSESVKKEVHVLKKELHKLKLERDVLKRSIEVLKKEMGADITKLSNKDKAIIISTLITDYSLSELLVHFKMAKSSYFYQINSMKKNDKYSELRVTITEIFANSRETYGYRRISCVLKTIGVTVSEKVIRRIMKEESLIVRKPRKRKYNSYKGEISPAVPNLIKRKFHSNKPNEKWLTDITEFSLPTGKVYLSPIIDCFDGMPVSWSIGTSPDASLTNSMLDKAIDTLKPDEKPIIHSDRGAHYRWPEWIKKTEEASLIRSMSKKGCSPDNSACEGFFGRIKNEMFYERDWSNVSQAEFIDILDEYLYWYVEERVKLSLGGMSPLQFRRSL